MVLFIGLIVLAVPAAGWSTSYSWSGPGYSSPFGMPGGLNSPYSMFGSPFGSSFGYGSSSGYSSPFGYGSMFGGSPFSDYSYDTTPAKASNSLFSGDMFSGPGDTFGGSIFKQKQYGTPPTDAIKATLVGSNLTYKGGYMGIPLTYTLDASDIGDIAGTQYNGEDAWKVRVGQAGIYWDVILDSTGTKILDVSQV
ncbi:MAG TPA: hypothetical protein VMC84_07765 [Methanocella sp.]|uniref:hypothetical protein n=1 Tax=Methanocella sp. TaxID=2052833 RepID=UPI002BA1E0A4|nr:hypothetical protein [Methanocella sp.]HTY91055.1 hypothetical protein [Methanocella sp.]